MISPDGRAAVFHGTEQPFTLDPFAVPALREGEILVRMRCCTLCRSDLHTYAGRRTVPTPTILGHETVGTVEAFGENAARFDANGTPLALGERVSWSVFAGCGNCFFCTHDLPQKCESLIKYGHEPMTTPNSLYGGLADYLVLVPGTVIVRVPDTLSDALAASAACATATVAGAIRGINFEGASVLILGAGLLGLNACAMACAGNAKQILVSDPDMGNRERAKAFGATRVFTADSDEQAHNVAEATAGRGADIILEFAGVAASVESALRLARIGGTVLLVGSVFPAGAIALLPETLVRRCLTVRGVHNYGRNDLQTALGIFSNSRATFPIRFAVWTNFSLARH